MITAILGGGVDTGAIPTGVHLVIAVLAITANLVGLRVEVIAMVTSSQIVLEVDELLKEQP